MDSVEAADASGDAISTITSLFMMDMDTYAHGGELGFDGVDFYISGRGGVLGDAPASVVVAAFGFWTPQVIVKGWEQSAGVMPRRQAAEEFAGVSHRWAEAHVPDGFDAARLAELAGRISDGATVAAAPLYAGWLELDEPGDDRPAALAIHRMNALRELRGAMHASAVLCQGIHPHAAVSLASAHFLGLYGWGDPHPGAEAARPRWKDAMAATEVAMAPAYEALSGEERAEFVSLANDLKAAVTQG